jgi:hypothetical protein
MATVSNDQRERLVSYISHQAAKGPGSIRGTIQKGHHQLLGIIDGLSEQQATFKPSPDVWSVLEVLRHAVDAERGVGRSCAALARGETPAGQAQPGRSGGALPSLTEARSALDAAHDELLAFVATLSPETNLEARFEHPFFGPLNCQEWAVFQRVHDGDHAEQIEQIKAAEGFPAA